MSITNEANRLKLSSRTGSRFGHLSHNMFFARESAHPRRLRFFPGLNGRPVQIVDDSDALDQQALPSIWNSSHFSGDGQSRPPDLPIYAINWSNLSRLNKDTLNTLQFFTGLRNFSFKEQQAPKQLTGLAPLVETWKNELSAFAENVFHKEAASDRSSVKSAATTRVEQNTDEARKQLYSRKTGRLIESRSGRRSSSLSVRYPPIGKSLNTDDLSTLSGTSQEHEYVILQMLGQILQTEDPQAIGTWLASASDREKALALELIRSVVESRSDYFQHETCANTADSAKPASAPPSRSFQGTASTSGDLSKNPSRGLFTIQEELATARDAGSAQTKADILNVDEERRLFMASGGKLYGYEGEDVILPQIPASRKSSAPARLRESTPTTAGVGVNDNYLLQPPSSQQSCPHCGHCVESWRPATSYVGVNNDECLPINSTETTN